jgi:hypothetical protein
MKDVDRQEPAWEKESYAGPDEFDKREKVQQIEK